MAERHIVVSDESGTTERYRTVGFVAGPEHAVVELNKKCKSILATHKISEIKWSEIESGEKRRAAVEALPHILDCSHCRVMVMSWDSQDTRRKGLKVDETEDFQRMLFHGLRNVAEWFGDVEWWWFPDKLTSLREQELKDFLNNTVGFRALAQQRNFEGTPRSNLRFTRAEQRCSKEVPVIGLADFFAGAVRHSIRDFEGCRDCRLMSGGQDGLGFVEDPSEGDTRGLRARREMVVHLKQECDSRKLGVSLSNESRLATYHNRNKLWLWHYEPQRENDKAPQKVRKT